MAGRRSQPRGTARLRRGHPLVRGLQMVFLPEFARQTDFFGGKFTTTIGTWGFAATVQGRAYQSSTAQVKSTRTLPWGGPFTIIAVAQEVAADSDYFPLAAGGNYSSGTGFWMGHSQGPPSGGTTSLAVSNGTADVSCGPAALGKRVVFGGTSTGSSMTGWLNGTKGNTSALSCTGTTVMTLFQDTASLSVSTWNTPCELILWWNRVLSDNEMRAIMANPWGVFAANDNSVEYVAGGSNGSATGATVTATASVLAGAASGSGAAAGATVAANASLAAVGAATGSAVANNATMAATASVLPGNASVVNDGAASGATPAAAASVLPGAASGAAAAAGATVSATASLLAGNASSTGDATAIGATVAATASILPGNATGTASGAAAGAVIVSVASLLAGAASNADPAPAGNDRTSYDPLKMGRLMSR